MPWLEECAYNPDRRVLINLNGSYGPPAYAILGTDIVTPRPINMKESPKWVRNTIPKGQLGYLPEGHRIVSPFGIKYVYR